MKQRLSHKLLILYIISDLILIMVMSAMVYWYFRDVMFILKFIPILLLSSVVLLLCMSFCIRKMIVTPVDAMIYCISGFRYESEDDRFENVHKVESLEIHTGDEIETLYIMLVSAIKEAVYYMSNLNKAKDALHDKDKVIEHIRNDAYVDKLTKVGNKNAYENEVKRIDEDIKAGAAKFGVVMMDVNNLKYINDTYGHEHGDNYIKGCCELLCFYFKHSPIFRIGGDEFVAIVRGRDYQHYHEQFRSLDEAYLKQASRRVLQPYERYSASIGISAYADGDSCYSDVFNRADKHMYQYKEELHRMKGAYR